MTKKYNIKYKIEKGTFTKEEIRKEDAGGCDNVILISVMGTPLNKEVMSIQPIPISGTEKELDADQIFEILNGALCGLQNIKEKLHPNNQEILLSNLNKTRLMKKCGMAGAHVVKHEQ